MKIKMVALGVVVAAGMLAVSLMAQPAPNVEIKEPAAGNPSGPKTGGPHTWTYEVVVSNYQAGEKPFCDFHVYGHAGKQLNIDSTTNPQGWVMKKAANGGIVFIADGHCLGNGTHTFTLTTQQSGGEKLSGDDVDLVATNTGNPAREDGDELDEFAATGPVRIASISGEDPFGDHWGDVAYSIPIGETSNFDINMSAPAANYEVYSSIVSLDDWSDPLGLGIRSVSDPIPSAWGLSFTDASGVLDLTGAADFSITVPDDPGLVGHVFFLVGTLKTGPDITDRILHDVKVTIVN